MPELLDGQSAEVQGSARMPYVLKNIDGVYSCTCPAWRNQSLPIEQRTCKHLRSYRGEAAESARLGNTGSAASVSSPKAAKAKPPALLLAETWDGEQNITNWWCSEKLDGVRAYWDGSRFLSRQGNVYHAPSWFTSDLPPFPLDGELWLERKAFQRTVSIVRRHDQPREWRSIRYVIFDAPEAGGPFETRLQTCREHFEQFPALYVEVLAQEPCRGADHLREELARIEQLGGEGLMLRQPESRYEPRRSGTLLKVKTFHDAEAQVIGHQPGAGRHRGRLGALLVQLADGTQFAVGTGFSDRQRETPPAIGTRITFRYQEFTNRGVPRFPTFVRVRSDGQA
jgi:DNA ligase-1